MSKDNINGTIEFEIPPKPEVPVLSCGRLELVLEKPKTARGKAKWVRRWRMWNDNAEMIEDVFRLFVDLKNDRVLDPFYGAGNFYTAVRPKKLVARDIRIDGFDARTMRTPGAKKAAYKDGSFQVVVLDPPYVSKGGRDTSTIPDMDEAYGMYDAPRTPAEVQQLINESMESSLPLVAEDGYIMQKTMNYVSSGAIFDSVRKTKEWAEFLGLTLVGEFVFSSQLPGPQPLTNLDGSPRIQEHGRNNVSTLLVFQKRAPKRTRKTKVVATLNEMADQVVENAKGLVEESKSKKPAPARGSRGQTPMKAVKKAADASKKVAKRKVATDPTTKKVIKRRAAS